MPVAVSSAQEEASAARGVPKLAKSTVDAREENKKAPARLGRRDGVQDPNKQGASPEPS